MSSKGQDTNGFILVARNDGECYRMYMAGCTAEAIWEKYSKRFIGIRKDQIDFEKANEELKRQRARVLFEKEPR
jgi:hypothetical protein